MPGATNAALGRWVSDDGHDLRCQDRRGWVEYAFEITDPDTYVVTIGATQAVARGRTSFLLLGSVDEEYIGRGRIDLSATNRTALVTPWLTNGQHTLRLVWNNVYDNSSLRITKLALSTYDSADSDGNGVKDWVEHRLDLQCSLEPPAETVISPACVEGKGRFLSGLSLQAEADGTVLDPEVAPGAGHRWYADVALSETGITAVAATFQDGARQVTNALVWTPLNLLDLDGVSLVTSNRIHLRQGDALRLAACPVGRTNGTVGVSVSRGGQSVAEFSGAWDDAFAHVFAEPGEYTVQGTHYDPGPTAGTLSVLVVDGGFPAENPMCWLDKPRPWSCPDLPAACRVESDASTTVTRNPDDGRLELTLHEVDDAHHLVARLGPGGPILDSRRLDGFWLRACVNGFVTCLETLPDGTEVIEDTMFVHDLPAAAEVRLRIFVGGVTFEDGTLGRTVTRADFSPLGELSFRMLRGPDVRTAACHFIDVYQDSIRVGRR